MGKGSNVIKRLKIVNTLSHKNTDQKYHPLSLYMSKKSVYGLQQVTHMKNAQMVKKLKTTVVVVDKIDEAVVVNANLVYDELLSYIK